MSEIERLEDGIRKAAERGDRERVRIYGQELRRLQQSAPSSLSYSELRERQSQSDLPPLPPPTEGRAPLPGRAPNFISDPFGRKADAMYADAQGRVMERLRADPMAAEVLGDAALYDEALGASVTPQKQGQLTAFLRGAATEGAGLLGNLGDLVAAGTTRPIENAIRYMTGGEQVPYFGSADELQRILSDAGVGYRTKMEINPSERPAAAGGETAAATATFIPALRSLPYIKTAATGATEALAAPSIRGVRQATQRQNLPLSAEFASGTGASLGAMTAEQGAPGDPNARLGFELLGAATHPLYVGIRAASGYEGLGKSVVDKVKSNVKTVTSGEFRKQKAQQAIVDQVRKYGEDPQDLLARLRELSPEGFSLDIELGSDGLTAMANYLGKKNPAFAKAYDQRNADALDGLARIADRLATTQDPEALNKAAVLYRGLFTDLFEANKEAAIEKARKEAAKLGKDPAKQTLDAGVALEGAIDDALKAAKAMEREAWGQLPRDQKIAGTALLRSIRDLYGDLLPGESPLPDPIMSKFVDEFVRDGIANSGQMQTLRSRLMDAGRKFAADGNASDARHIRILADAVLDDLAEVPGSELARTISREMHEAFTQTYAGESLRTSRSGASRVDPGSLAARTLAGGGGGTQPLIRAQEARQAAGFVPSRVGELSDDAQAIAASAPERAGRAQAAIEGAATADLARTVDPNTGRVSTTRLGGELRDMQSLEVPQASAQGRRALDAELMARQREEATKRRISRLDGTTLGEVAKKKKVPASDVVKATLMRSDAPDAFAQLAKIAGNKRLPEETRKAATADLIAGTYGASVKKATKGDALSFGKLRVDLLRSPGQGKPAPIDLLEQNGLITPEHAREVRRFITKGDLAERQMARPKGAVDDFESPTPIIDFITKVAGARAGSVVGKALPGPGNIQTPGFGAKLMTIMLNKMPAYNVQEMVTHGLMDREFLELALSSEFAKGKYTLPMRQKFNRVTASMVQAGLISKEDAEELEAMQRE